MNPSTTRPHPPRIATRLLRWYCAPHLLEEIEGDLSEEFYIKVTQSGAWSAKVDYVRSVIGFMKPFAIRKKSTHSSTPLLNMNMFKHYGIIAWRSLIRYRAFSTINILGLALGMTCCLFILLWVQDERRIDNFPVDVKNLYTAYETVDAHGQVSSTYTTPMRYNKDKGHVDMDWDEVPAAVPEVESICYYATGYDLPWGHPEVLQIGEKVFKLNGSRAGEKFLTMLSYPVIAGNAGSALIDPHDIAISRKTCSLFFTSPEEAIGKTIRYENKLDLKVTAVFEDIGPASSLKFDFLLTWKVHLKGAEWASNDNRTFVRLKESASVRNVEAKINKVQNLRLDKNSGFTLTCGLQPVGDHYLHSTFVNGKPEGGRIEYVRMFSGVAVFILLMACINFMNLATARSVKRAKEVGVRKVVGSSRFNLIGQFFGESMLMSLLAFVLSIALLHLLLPAFNEFTDKQIPSPLLTPSSWLWLLGLVAITGLVSGSYPALFLSSLKPVLILKGVLRFTASAVWFRRSLAVFQFTMCIFLLIATLVISQQTQYVQNTHLGYDRENLLYFRIEGEVNPKYDIFKDKALKMPGVAMVDRSSEAPHAMGFVVDVDDGASETADGRDAIAWEGKEKRATSGFKPTSVGYDFVKLLNLKIAEGRDFSKDNATDSADAFMVNEAAVREMGMKDPIGKWVSAWNKKGHIIGVIKDYHTHSLHEPIKPLIVDVKEYEYFGVVLVRTEPGKTKEAIASLEKIYKEINPNYPFQYQFIDIEYGKLYRNEQIMATLSNGFALVAILISCLGLLGLVMFSAEQRIKEIGVRKVLGATAINIVGLLSRDFLRLIAVAFVIAVPAGAYFMNEWLQSFAFQIELSWWIFAVAGVGAMTVALLTISVQAIQTAVASPVKALRAE